MNGKKAYPFLVLLVILLVFSFVFTGCGKTEPEEDLEEEETKEEEMSPPEIVRQIAPIAVIIANNASARPQSGLQEASLVYEFLVEGGITRFLVIFDALPEEDMNIGPVRSLRPYFAHQAIEHVDKILHGGYSSKTAEKIKGLDLTHVVSSTYLWRDSSRKAPHNLYTDAEKIAEAAGGSTLTEKNIEGPPPLPSGYEEGLDIEISYSSSNVVSYAYDSESKAYLRFFKGEPHTDRETGEQYRARRVILRHTRHSGVADTNLVHIDLNGEGQAYLYEEGRKYDLRWEKKDGITHYYFEDDTPVDISYGNTWIQVVRR